jgi:hypothetical protein
MSSLIEMDLNGLSDQIVRLRGRSEQPPDASIVIPVNAQGDLRTALKPLGDIVRYIGQYRVEIILVINNFPAANPPVEIEQFRELGVQVVAAPSARRPGEVVIISARALGVQAVRSNITIHFDADCRIADINALLDWYIQSLTSGAQLAYSQVDFYETRGLFSIRIKMAIHHTVRWIKRHLLGIPTTRGSNYAIDRSLFLQLYEAGKLSVDLQVGPAAKLAGARIVYSSQPSLTVYTSGRKFRGGWTRLFRMLRYRFRYNLGAIPTRHRSVTRTSWDGFDRESERREVIVLPGESEVSAPHTD